jgi:hypothetical protein
MPTRDLRLDSLRGIFLVIMTVDHLNGKLSQFTYAPFGFISAAEGFVMLSGYMYAFTSAKTGATLSALAIQSRKRAAKIYRYHLGLLILLLPLTLVSAVYLGYLNYLYPSNGGALTALVYGAVLVHQPPFMHILPMYMMLSLLSPAMLMGLHRGRDGMVLGISITFWLCGQFFDPLECLVKVSGTGPHPGAFNLFSWQLLWTIGLYIGFLHRVRNKDVLLARPIYLWLAIVTTLGFFLAKHHVFSLSPGVDFFLEKSDLRFLRVTNIVCQIVVFCYLIRLARVDKGLPWFSLLGRYALPVFSFHVLIVCLLEPVTWRVGVRLGNVADVAYSFLVAASLTLPALVYRAYERQLSVSGPVTWSSKLSAMTHIVRHLL